MKRLLLTLALLLAVSLPLSSCGAKEEKEYTPNAVPDMITDRAVEGRDYTIDDVRVAVSDYKAQNGQITYMSYGELRSLVRERKALGEEIHFRVTVKYTALRELVWAGVEMHLSFWSFEGGSQSYVYRDYRGNVNQENMLKSHNLLPGVHYLSFDVDIPAKDTEGDYIGVIENLDELDTDLTYKFYVGH